MKLQQTIDFFENCDFTSRESVKEKLIKYVMTLFKKYVGSSSLKAEHRHLAEDLAEGILQDIEVEEYSLELWENSMLSMEKNQRNNFEDAKVIKQLIDEITDADRKERFTINYCGDDFYGICKYTVRYSQTNTEKIEKGIMQAKEFLDNQVDRKFYEKIYPLFWLEMINKCHMSNKSRRRKQDDKQCLIDPIYRGSEKEMYLSALLLDCRKERMKDYTIFSEAQKVYLERLKKAKKNVEECEMQVEEERLKFVKKMKEILFGEKTSGNRNKITLINNLATIRQMLEMGESNNIDIPVFIFFLDRLTGWIEFYNFVSLENSSNDKYYVAALDPGEENKIKRNIKKFDQEVDKLLDEILNCKDKVSLLGLIKQVTEKLEHKEDLETALYENEKSILVDRAAFQYMIEFNHMAFLYVLGKRIQNIPWLKDMYQSVLGKEFCEKIAEAYDVVIAKKQYTQEDGITLKSEWYYEMYNELFVNDFSKVSRATRMEALNFYDAYITYKNDYIV